MSENPLELSDRLYGPWEVSIESWSHLQEEMNRLTSRYDNRVLVWRGARRAEWGVMSSLYRELVEALGRPPKEDEMVSAERRILDLARSRWRFDHLPALEILAHLQHYGGPTRLLDVSFNPLIAAWFAVEQRSADDRADGRLFAFMTAGTDVRLGAYWYGRSPRWHQQEYRTDAGRLAHGWGSGTRRRLWRPPAFNERISAQNAAFLIDGVPLTDSELDGPRVALGTRSRWQLEELKKISSINFRLEAIREGDLPSDLAPVFTFRLLASAKAEIRDQLERRHGFDVASVYSDMSGLASYLATHPEVLV